MVEMEVEVGGGHSRLKDIHTAVVSPRTCRVSEKTNLLLLSLSIINPGSERVFGLLCFYSFRPPF